MSTGRETCFTQMRAAMVARASVHRLAHLEDRNLATALTQSSVVPLPKSRRYQLKARGRTSVSVPGLLLTSFTFEETK